MPLQLTVSNFDQLFEHHAKNASDVVLVAPYVKTGTLQWLLSLFGENCQIRLLTRARLQDFVLGASDIDCWPMIWERGGQVFLEQSLHAKYYRFDNTVFFGSANITDSALNRRIDPNLEMLGIHPFDESFQLTEKTLLSGRVCADKNIFMRLKPLIVKYKNDKGVVKLQRKFTRLSSRHDTKLENVTLPDHWAFRTKHPVNLWKICRECTTSSQSELTPTEMEAALADLKLLRILPNDVLTEEDLRRMVAERVKSWSVILKLHHCFDQNNTPDRPYLRYGFIRDTFNLEDDREFGEYQGTVNTFLDWMVYFFPKVFFNAPSNHSRLLGRYCQD